MRVDQRVDGVFGLGGRQCTPAGDLGGQLGVHGGHRHGVGDQPGLKQGGHLGQPVAQRHPAMGLVQRQPAADVLGCGQLGGHRGLGIDPPQFALVGVQAGASGEQFGHHRLLARAGGVLRPHPAAPHQSTPRPERSKVADLMQRAIEHMYCLSALAD